MMLSPNDVRVGSIVQNLYTQSIEELSIVGYSSIITGTGPSFRLKPIPFTPGWAERFGGKYTPTTSVTTYTFPAYGAELFITFPAGSYGEVLLGEIKLSIPHVHVFQNVYYILSGIFLTLKSVG